MRIVVLDDQRGIGELLQQALGLDGRSVVAYSSPSEFLATLTEPTTTSRPFDLLIVDLFLSEGTSGVEVTHHVWNVFPDLPVILVSEASSWQIEPVRGALPGVRVVGKPFSIETLLAMVKDFSK